jgi:AcrR family transcriptional regulator
MAGTEPDEGGRDRLEGVFRRFFRRRPRQARSRFLVDALLEAFDEGVRADGNDVTIDDVSRRAGVGIGSFYEYFTGKDALIGAFVGRVTSRNFDLLARRMRELEHDSIEDEIRAFADVVSEAYLAHPRRMRLLVDGISRLNLIHVVNRERDRFAEEVMTPRALVHLPGEDPARVGHTMRILADAAMGLLVSHTSRAATPTTALVSDDLATLGIAVLRARHTGATASSP